MLIYKPSPKGVRRGLSESDRIAFINEHYVWLDTTDNGYQFQEGDAFEWKPKFSRPDSLWKPVDEIDSSTITGVDRLSDYNLKVNADELKQMEIPNGR